MLSVATPSSNLWVSLFIVFSSNTSRSRRHPPRLVEWQRGCNTNQFFLTTIWSSVLFHGLLLTMHDGGIMGSGGWRTCRHLKHVWECCIGMVIWNTKGMYKTWPKAKEYAKWEAEAAAAPHAKLQPFFLAMGRECHRWSVDWTVNTESICKRRFH